MAWNGNKRKGGKGKGRHELESLSYKMGQIERGLSNKDSKVYASYEAGKKKTEYKKKPLL